MKNENGQKPTEIEFKNLSQEDSFSNEEGPKTSISNKCSKKNIFLIALGALAIGVITYLKKSETNFAPQTSQSPNQDGEKNFMNDQTKIQGLDGEEEIFTNHISSDGEENKSCGENPLNPFPNKDGEYSYFSSSNGENAITKEMQKLYLDNAELITGYYQEMQKDGIRKAHDEFFNIFQTEAEKLNLPNKNYFNLIADYSRQFVFGSIKHSIEDLCNLSQDPDHGRSIENLSAECRDKPTLENAKNRWEMTNMPIITKDGKIDEVSLKEALSKSFTKHFSFFEKDILSALNSELEKNPDPNKDKFYKQNLSHLMKDIKKAAVKFSSQISSHLASASQKEFFEKLANLVPEAAKKISEETLGQSK